MSKFSLTLNIFTLFLLGFFASRAESATQKWPFASGGQIILNLKSAHLNIQNAASSTFAMTTSAACSDLLSEANETKLSLYQAGEDLKEEQDTKAPVCQIQLTVPRTVKLSIHLLSGQIIANQLSSDLFVHIQAGQFVSKNSAGKMILHSQKGDFQVLGGNGQLSVDLGQTQLLIKDFVGDMDLTSLASEINIEKFKGDIRSKLGQANLKVTKSSGNFNFESNRGGIMIDNFAGRIEGSSQETSLNIKMIKDSEAHLKPSSGKINIQVPAGFWINASTQEGDLVGPTGLSVSKEGAAKIIRGRSKGEASKGSLTLRSQEANVYIR